ncbi:MAG: amino acid adenylation domain-containing protein [Pseudonocardiaceae bacterium]
MSSNLDIQPSSDEIASSSSPEPLTSYQRDVWVSNAHLPGHPQFTCMISERFDGTVDLDLLRACTLRAVLRHDAWHLRFAEDAGTPYQWAEVNLPRIDTLDFTEEPDSRQACAAWQRRAALRVFPLTDGAAPYEFTLLRETPSVTHLHLVCSHIITDAWSARMLIDEILADYEHTLRTGTPAALPGSSYLRFAKQARQFSAERRDLDNSFFTTELAGVSPALFPRRQEPGRRGSGLHTFTVNREVVARVRGAGVTPTAYLAAVLSLLLCRTHRTDEVVVGVPFANRSTEEHRRVHGLFSSVLPLRTRIAEGVTMRELALGVRGSLRTLRDYEHVSLGDTLRTLPSGDGPHQLFDVTLSSMRYPAQQEVPGASHSTDYSTPVHDQDALSVFVYSYEGQDDLGVTLDYAHDVFDANLPIEVFAEAYRHLIHQGVELFDRPVAELALLTGSAPAGMLAKSAGPRREFDRDATLHGLFERRAVEDPERTALITAGGARLSYAHVNTAANQVANALRADGVGTGDLVAVLLRRGPDLVIAILGVLKAGAAYVPIDLGYPVERIRFMLRDSAARLVLAAQREIPDGVPDERLRMMEDLRSGDATPAAAPTGPRELAYVIYTSGSTGTPKGVMVEHRSVVNRLTWMQRAYPIGPGDVLLQKTPATFDVSVWELFWWVIGGATLALAAPGAERDPRQLLHAISEHGVTAVHFVPSMLGPFLDVLERSPGRREQARSLRHVICSGEALPAARVEQFHRIFGDGSDDVAPLLSNLYGPTEATVDVSAFDCAAGSAGRGGVPIGTPIDNVQLYVLDDALRPVPDGMPGELCIAGVGLARGYLNRPELTEEKFVQDPLEPGERLYRTGDLARRLADGNLEYLGRLDRQVKIRGNRVELGEVESALMRVPGVTEAAVFDHEFAGRGTLLVAYYVAEGDRDPEALRAELATTVPEFMIPSYFHAVPRIPLTPNGKADRAALPAVSAPAAGGEYTAPRTAVEATLATVLAQVLGTGPVGVHDNYYVLGGDSISALVVQARAAEHGLRFSLTDLMRHPTVAELAPHVQVGTEEERELEPFALVSAVDRPHLGDCVDAFGLTRLQLGMLYHSRRYRDSTLYHDVFRYSLRMPWREPELRAAFARLVARHPALRSTFTLASYSEPLQVVHAEVADRLEVVDLRGYSPRQAEREIAEHVESRRTHRYESDPGPAYLVRVHRCAATVELVLSFHHALLDGGSVANLLTELFADYRHGIGHAEHPAPAGPLPSPAHHVRAERRALESTVDSEYWRRLLDGAAPAQLPGLSSAAPGKDEEFIVEWSALPEGTEDAVRRFAAAHDVPVKSVLFAAYAQTLRLLCGGDEDLMTGMVTHSRPERAGADRMAGLFLNTVPVRLPAAPVSWLDAVHHAYRAEREGHEHRRYPFSAIREDSGGRAPFETVFNYINFHALADVLGVPGVELLDYQTVERTNFALLVNVLADPRDGRLRLRIDADPAVVTRQQVGLFERYFAAVLRRILGEPDGAVDFGFLAPSVAPAAAPVEPLTDVLRRFDAQVRRTPEAVAVVLGERRWTYRELAGAADAVARRLLAEGGRPGELTVGIAMDRSPELVAAVLGVQRAGGACVPLDVSYPPARLAAMLCQARPSWVLADAANASLAGDTPVLVVPEGIPEDLADPAGGPAPLPEIDLADPAYVLFTSGSTGEPKGVVMPHRTLANLIAWQDRAPSAAPGGATLQYAPLSFDVSFQEIFSTLCTGGTLCLVTEAQRRDMTELLRLIDEAAVTRVFLPYVALQQVAVTAEARGRWPRALRVVVSSGEQLRVTGPIRALCAAGQGTILENQYGPTETHVVTSYTLSGDPSRFPDLPPIGWAIDGVDVRVLDARLRPVPVGALGAIHVGGVCLADGYRDRPELTEERFVHDAEGNRLYRTGDLGVLAPDGSVVYLGRADRQVKVRGFRVEPAEVEQAIAGWPGIKEVAVVARRRHDDETILVGFLVGDAAGVDRDAMLASVRATLPEHMVPTHLHWLDEVPRTPSGKRDDDALRRIPLAARTRGAADEPGDEYERALAGMLAELIEAPELGVHDDIFELGATSLTAIRLTTRVEQRYGVHLPLAALAEKPTVAGLAERLRQGHATSTFDPLVTLRSGGRRAPLFLVHPMGGGVLCYLPLARHLPEDLPFYALQAAGSEPGTEPVPAMPELAARYLAAMRRVQPEGPYTIGGWSFGGFVAFEMARQLRANGEDVADLLLIDSTALNPGGYRGSADESMLNWFFWELLWMHRGADAPEPVLPEGLGGFLEQTEYIAEEAVRLGVLPSDSSGAVIRRLFRLYRANLQAVLDYWPEPLESDITLLRTVQPLPDVLRPMHDMVGTSHDTADNGWTRWTNARLMVVAVPGDHLSLMTEPHVRTLATTIDEQIGR